MSSSSQLLSNTNLETYGIAHLLDSNNEPTAAQAYIVERLVDEIESVLGTSNAKAKAKAKSKPSSIPTSRDSTLNQKFLSGSLSTISPGRSVFLPAYPNLRHRADVALHLRKKATAYKSIIHPIRRMPVFLWSYIFQMMIEEEDADQLDMVSYSQVCSKWRTAVVGTPELWQKINVRVDKDWEEVWDDECGDEVVGFKAGEVLREFTKTIMRRSGDLGVDVSLEYDDEGEMNVARDVFETFRERERWKSLTTGVVGFSELFSDVCQIWDRLEKVVITQRGDSLLRDSAFGEFSLLSACKLRRLTMEWNGVLPDCTRYLLPWSQLYELHLDVTYCTVAEHLGLIADCPSLRVLSIALTTCQINAPKDRGFFDRLEGGRIIHTRIHTFTFIARHMDHAQLFKHVAFPSLNDLVIKFNYAPKGWFFMPRGKRDKRGGRLNEIIEFLEASGSEKTLKSFEFWTKFNMPWRDFATLFGAIPAVEEISVRVGNEGNYVSSGGSDMVEDIKMEIKREIESEDKQVVEQFKGRCDDGSSSDSGSEATFDSGDSTDRTSVMSPTPSPSEDSGIEDTTLTKVRYPARPFMPDWQPSTANTTSSTVATSVYPVLPRLEQLNLHGKFIQLPIIMLLRLVRPEVIILEEPIFLPWYEEVAALNYDVKTNKLEVTSNNEDITKEMISECIDIASKQAFGRR